MTSPALLAANDLALAYGHQRLLEQVTLSVAPGEKVGLVGRNGCGKTSLLRILAGYQRADAGEVTLPEDGTAGRRAGKLRYHSLACPLLKAFNKSFGYEFW